MISIRNLSKHYGQLVVLRDISTEISKGEIISVIGPSGTGKSTLLRCMNLLETPSGGEIIIDGMPMIGSNSHAPALRQRMGMVFQSFNLYEHLTVLENLTLAPVKLRGLSKKAASQKALELLKMVGLAEKKDSLPRELSGGQKQRVAIARCMAMEPEILLFDEPTSALDPTMVSEVLAVIRRLSREGMTMVIVTHEMEFARNISTRVLYMDEGIIYEEGPPADIFDNPQKEKTRAYINRIRSLQIKVNSPEFDIFAIHGQIEQFCEKHQITKRMTTFIMLLVEEILLLQNDFSDISMQLSYSEKDGSLDLSCQSAGQPYNLLKPELTDDDIGLRIIMQRTENLKYSYQDGKNLLEMKIRE